MRTRLLACACVLSLGVVLPSRAFGAPPESGAGASLDGEVAASVAKALAKGRAFLLTQRDAASGAFDAKGAVPVGFTAVATVALIGATPRTDVGKDEAILAGLAYLAGKQRENGSVWSNERFVNYETSAAVGAFAAGHVAKHATAQARARDYLLSSQITKDPADANYGGFPYVDEEPEQPTDLSNLQFALSALRDAGVPADHVVFRRALDYLARVQNRAETNTFVAKLTEGGETKEVVSGNDGGAVYAPGVSKVAHVKRADGRYVAPSYGSMTYALLKCLVLAGVKADDPRVVAAVAWLGKYFAVDRNPGFEHEPDPSKAGQQGYYYYVMTMARALAEFERATGAPLVLTDADGRRHAWREELGARLVALQRADGSWVNTVERWEESMPLLATSYAMQALAACAGRFP